MSDGLLAPRQLLQQALLLVHQLAVVVAVSMFLLLPVWRFDRLWRQPAGCGCVHIKDYCVAAVGMSFRGACQPGSARLDRSFCAWRLRSIINAFTQGNT